MPVTVLSTNALEESTYVITVAITDENDDAVTPITMTWTLSDTDGTIINSRSAIVYTADKGTGVGGTLSESMKIILNANDLQILGTTATETRVLTLQGTYNSTNGNGLPFKARCTFAVENLEVVT